MEADYGLISSDTKGLEIKNLTLVTKKTPVVDFKNCRSVTIEKLTTPTASVPVIRITGAKSDDINLEKSGITKPEKLVIDKSVPENVVRLKK
jgi:hypothetical protein